MSDSGFLGAVGLLTRVPARGSFTKATPWLPVVGGAIGLGVASVYAGAVQVLPSLPAAIVAVVAGILVTGAFHEDGLADTADALGAPDVSRRTEILKDPRLGTFGVLAVVCSFALRAAALAAMDEPTALAIVPAAHALGRASAIGLIVTVPAAPDGLGASYARGVSDRAAIAGIVAAIGIAVLGAGPWAFAAIALAIGGSLLVGRSARRSFPGLSGDLLGAAEQVVEVSVLLLGAAIASNGWFEAAWWM